MEIVPLNRRVFLINNFSSVQDDAAVHCTVIDELLKRLLRFFLVV